MNKDNKVFIGIIVILLICMIGIGVIVLRDKKEEQSKNGGNADSLVFKNEYESLNNVIREKDGKTIKEISISENDKVDIKEEGTTGYYKLLKLLDSVLEPYYLTNENGEKVDTQEKRLMAPTVVGFKNGIITEIHVGTVESQESGYDDLTIEEQEKLSNIFMELIRSVYDIDCDEAC